VGLFLHHSAVFRAIEYQAAMAYRPDQTRKQDRLRFQIFHVGWASSEILRPPAVLAAMTEQN